MWKKNLRRLLLVFAASAYTGDASADTPKENDLARFGERDDGTSFKTETPPERDLSFNFGSIYSFENNDKMWSSLHQLAGKGNDYVGIDLDVDKTILGRIGLGMASVYLTGGFQYYEHELSHEFNEENQTFKIDFSEWISPYGIGLYPQYKPQEDLSPQLKKYLISAITGLNQDEYSAYASWKRSVLDGQMNFDEGIFFLVHKLFDLQYILATETVLDQENFESQKKGFTSWWYEDSDGYIRLMEMGNTDLTKNEYAVQILASDMLSWHTWESIYSVFEYIANNNRTSKTTTVGIDNNLRITPPLISLYLTSQGSFYDFTSFVHYKKESVGISIGTDLDFAGGGDLNTIRAGGEFHSVTLNPVAIDPFCYLDFERTSFNYKGLAGGLELLLKVTSSTSLRGKFEYSTGDVMENTIKLESEGPNFVLGIDVNI